MFVFDEELGLLFARMKGLGIDLEAMQRQRAICSSSRSTPPNCRPANSRTASASVSIEDQIKTVVIDSLNGYQAAMPEENSLILHMHELLQYLNRQGAATFMTVAQHGLVGDMKAPVDVTYLADTVILLRYFEALGTVRRAMSVIKKRTGAHESTIREYRIDRRGLTIGEPLDGFQGVLRGVPVYIGEGRPLLQEPDAVKPGASSERAVILAPTGRDAAVAAALIREAGYLRQCLRRSRRRCMQEIESGAGLAVIADEAIKTADLRGLVRWLNDQPSWSDFPIVLLTRQGGGPERNPDAARLGQLLGNVTFIERPFHPTTLVSIVGSAVRARRRQYQTRAILARPHRKRRPAADRAERRPSRCAGTASAGVRARGLRHLQGLFRPPAGRAVHLPGPAGVGSSRRSRTACWTVVEQTIRTGKRLQHRIPQHLARRLAALGRRSRAGGAPAGRQHQIAGRRLLRHHRAQDSPKSSARICWRSWPPSAPRWPN